MRNTHATELLFDLSQPGRRAARFPNSDVPDQPLEEMIPDAFRRDDHDGRLPELTESDVIRHFLNLSTLNMSVDTPSIRWAAVR